MKTKKQQIVEILRNNAKMIGVDRMNISELADWLEESTINNDKDELFASGEITLEMIAKACAMAYDTTIENMQGKSRERPYPQARQLYAYFARLAFPQSADWQVMDVIKKNRTSINYYLRTVGGLVQIDDKSTCSAIMKVREILKHKIDEKQAA